MLHKGDLGIKCHSQYIKVIRLLLAQFYQLSMMVSEDALCVTWRLLEYLSYSYSISSSMVTPLTNPAEVMDHADLRLL